MRAIIFSFLLLVGKTYGQTPYYYNSDGTHGAINDSNWNTTTLFFDEEFSSEASTITRWTYGPGWHAHNSDHFDLTGDTCADNYTGCEPYDFRNNHNHTYDTSGGVTSVTLTLRKETPSIDTYYIDSVSGWVKAPRNYTMTDGKLLSRAKFKYGYFESRFKVNLESGSQSTGLGHCFWIQAQGPTTNYSEIDIAENSTYGGYMSSNMHYQRLDQTAAQRYSEAKDINDCNYYTYTNSYLIARSDRAVEQTTYHTYSLEWTPSEVNTYYDNILVRHIEHAVDKLDEMQINLDIEGALGFEGFQTRFCKLITNGITSLPFDFKIDFVKIYHLKSDYQDSSFTRNSYDFTNSVDPYHYSLKKDITLGQTSCSTCTVAIENGQKVSIRANDFIELEDGFMVDDNTGTEFFATTNKKEYE